MDQAKRLRDHYVSNLHTTINKVRTKNTPTIGSRQVKKLSDQLKEAWEKVTTAELNLSVTTDDNLTVLDTTANLTTIGGEEDSTLRTVYEDLNDILEDKLETLEEEEEVKSAKTDALLLFKKVSLLLDKATTKTNTANQSLKWDHRPELLQAFRSTTTETVDPTIDDLKAGIDNIY